MSQGHLLPPFPDTPPEPAVNTSGSGGAHWWLPSEAAPDADQPSAAARIGADMITSNAMDCCKFDRVTWPDESG